MLQNSLAVQGFIYLLSVFTGVELCACFHYLLTTPGVLHWQPLQWKHVYVVSIVAKMFTRRVSWTDFIMDTLENILCVLRCNTYIQADKMDAVSQTGAIHPGGVLLRVYTGSQNVFQPVRRSRGGCVRAEQYQTLCLSAVCVPLKRCVWSRWPSGRFHFHKAEHTVSREQYVLQEHKMLRRLKCLDTFCPRCCF